MRNWTVAPVGGEGGVGRLLLVAVAAIGTACASGGGGQAVMTRAEIDALLAGYAGNWVLDGSASSPPVTIPRPETRTETRVVRADQLDDLRREAEEGQRLMAIRQATFKVLRRRPEALVLGVQGDELVYSPTPGERIKLPLNGGWVSQTGGEHRVRTRVFRDGPRLGVEHMVGSDGRVSVVLEIVEGRLEMTRTMLFVRGRVAPMVLINGASGYLLLTGRTAIKATSRPMRPVPTMANTTATKMFTPDHTSTICSPMNAPNMNTSPWAKCSSLSTPKIKV